MKTRTLQTLFPLQRNSDLDPSCNHPSCNLSGAGFSLVEVMASMVITSIFVVAVLPILTTAATNLVVNRRVGTALNLIQRDVENIRSRPINCDLSNLPPLVASNDPQLQIVRPAPPTPPPDDLNEPRLLEIEYNVQLVGSSNVRGIPVIDEWVTLVWCDPPRL
jgi:prepilin-type N-terminal cleavage/methylation domain-containing protein